MKKILIASLSAALVCLSTTVANYVPRPELDIQYPFLQWSKTCISAFEEFESQTSGQDLVSKIKSTVYTSTGNLQASRMFIIRKDGMTTRDLLKAAKYLEYDRDTMFNHSIAFPYVETEGFDQETEALLSQTLGVKAEEYDIDSKDEIPVLAEQLASDTDPKLKIAIINVKHSLHNQILNDISEEVQVAVKKVGAISSYVMAIAGRKGTFLVPGDEPVIVSLQQTGSISLAQVTTTTNAKAATAGNSSVRTYLYPNVLTGILLGFMMLFFLIIGFLQLMSVQTPTYFSADKIDFGKIEN